MTDHTSPNVGNYTIPKSNIYFTPSAGVGANVRRHVGNCPEGSFEMEVEKLEHFSAMVGVKTKDFTAVISKSATVSITLEELTRANMNIALMGGALTADTEGDLGFEIGVSSTISGRLEFIASNDIGPKWNFDFPSVSFTPSEAIDLISNDDSNVASIGLTADVNAVNGSFGRATLQDSAT